MYLGQLCPSRPLAWSTALPTVLLASSTNDLLHIELRTRILIRETERWCTRLTLEASPNPLVLPDRPPPPPTTPAEGPVDTTTPDEVNGLLLAMVNGFVPAALLDELDANGLVLTNGFAAAAGNRVLVLSPLIMLGTVVGASAEAG